MGLWISLLGVLVLTLHDHIPEEDDTQASLTKTHTKNRRHCLWSCFESYSPVQIVSECRVLASTGDEEGAQVLLQRETIDNLSLCRVRISIILNCFFLIKTVFFSVTFSVSYLKILAVGSLLAFLRCGRGSRCAGQDLGTTERDNQRHRSAFTKSDSVISKL